MKSTCLMGLIVVLTCAGMMLNTGCESTSTQDAVITLSPTSTTLTGDGATASFVAMATVSSTITNELVLPLEWSISRSDLGRILSTAGVTAIYESNGTVGNNTITVKDQIGQAGVAVINQAEGVPANTP